MQYHAAQTACGPRLIIEYVASSFDNHLISRAGVHMYAQLIAHHPRRDKQGRFLAQYVSHRLL